MASKKKNRNRGNSRRSYVRQMRNANKKERGILFQITEGKRVIERIETEIAEIEEKNKTIEAYRDAARAAQMKEADDRLKYHNLRIEAIRDRKTEGKFYV